MHGYEVRQEIRRRLANGASINAVARDLAISRDSVRRWRDRPDVHDPLPRRLGTPEYAALLGYYLGDGCLSQARRTVVLRITCGDVWPGVMDDVERVVRAVHPERPVFRTPKAGCTDVQSSWTRWAEVFPQHGPGRKHERVLGLQPWQWAVVERHPGDFLRGLFHSDGCRVDDVVRRPAAGGGVRTCRYPRWQFVNASSEIRRWCCDALDIAAVAWRTSGPHTVSVSRREAVEWPDALIGLKS